MSEVNLRCPGCGNGVFISIGAGAAGTCSKCGREARADFLPAGGQPLACCGVCQRRDLYQQRDFNRNLGAAVATVTCLVSFGLFFWNWLAGLATLVGLALVDLALFLLLDEVVICYACGAVHRGFPKNPQIPGFNLVVLDRYEKRTGGPVSGGH